MTVGMTLIEAEILIAALTFAEGAALQTNPGMLEALGELRQWRSALLKAYLFSRVMEQPPAGDAVDPHVAK